MNPFKWQLISSLLQQEKLAVIATLNKANYPQTALIAYAEDKRLCLYFQTGQHTRKAHNLTHNSKVALSIGLKEENKMTLQYEGIAQQLGNSQEIKSLKQRFLDKKSPTTIEYLERADAIFFKITPTWIRYSDYSHIKNHPTVFECSFG